MEYRIWYSSEGFADYIIDHTILKSKKCQKRKLFESDARFNEFHTIPDHIKKILYLDAHDLIIEVITSNGFEPIVSIEESKEAGTGHNSFQRFARLAASVENSVPTIYIYPEATVISRGTKKAWDKINPNIFLAMEEIMQTHQVPALLFYYPTYFKSHPIPASAPILDKGRKEEKSAMYRGCPLASDTEMLTMFQIVDGIVQKVEKVGPVDARNNLLTERVVRTRRNWMKNQYFLKKSTGKLNSPVSATTVLPTPVFVRFIEKQLGGGVKVGELINSRSETVVYQIDGEFRGDPYPGGLAALDYIMCRYGKSFEERDKNLVICFGTVKYDSIAGLLGVTDNPLTKKSTIKDLTDDVIRSETRNLLKQDFGMINKKDIPRYFMQMRYGSTFSKVKHIRVYSYFADAIIFPDGSLWRDA